MNFGVQYYRAPFPDAKHWESDFKKIRESGFNTVQLWISWGWVEATPDRFVYDDYDRLVELAAKHRLGVVLSTIAEIQPNWIHRLVPGSEMVDNFGHKVVSSARGEHHFGITPGGCTDHPGVWERMARFIETTGRRYAGLDHLRGWDIWNELRWNVNADALVCFCPHTLAAYRCWLEKRFGSLEGLNEAWKRRYACWEDVMPGKLPDRPYTELMSFQHFLTCRADEHARRRYGVMRAVDPVHLITAHGACPSALYSGDPGTYPVDRGNDWFLADALDGIGCSSFPQWFDVDDADFGLRIDMVKSAARGRKVWLSELQGGRAAVGFNTYGVVRAAQQQRWLWNGLGCGADTILFWCWRDEVFGRESAGFGISGRDGCAEERLAATRVTGELWERYAELFDHYVPDRAEVGLLFSPQSYYLGWAQEGSGDRIRDGLAGYGRALTRSSIPLLFVEEEHLDGAVPAPGIGDRSGDGDGADPLCGTGRYAGVRIGVRRIRQRRILPLSRGAFPRPVRHRRNGAAQSGSGGGGFSVQWPELPARRGAVDDPAGKRAGRTALPDGFIRCRPGGLSGQLSGKCLRPELESGI